MPRPLWLHIDGGLLIAIGDYVLTEDVNVDLALFFFAKSDYTGESSHCLEVTSIHLKAKQISQTFSFLRSVSENAAQYSKN